MLVVSFLRVSALFCIHALILSLMSVLCVWLSSFASEHIHTHIRQTKRKIYFYIYEMN